MMDPLRVDILILSWNRVDDTVAAIESAREQIGLDVRIIVVDQGSETPALERLRALVESIPNAILKELGENVGVAGGRNVGASLGESPFLIALDSDAVFASAQTAMLAVRHLSERNDLCAVAFRITNFFSRENDWTSWDYPKSRSPDEPFETTRFIGAGHAIRRSTFQRVGGYDARLFFCGEELDLCYRMLNTGLRIQYYPTAEILHKVSLEHRVFWSRGRFFYTVRNSLYSMHKFHSSPIRLLTSFVGFTLKGASNLMPFAAVRAAWAAWKMARTFRKSSEDKAIYRLSEDTKVYIRSLEPWRSDGFLTKLRRQFSALPHQQ